MNKKTLFLFPLFAICLLFSFQALAETSNSDSQNAPAVSNVESRIAELKKLRDENPEKFRQLVESRKTHIKNQLQEFRSKNPEKFESFKQNILQQRRQQLRQLRRQNPQEFHQRMQQRMEQFQRWQAANPERSRQFLQNHPRLANRIPQRQQNQNGISENARWERRRQGTENKGFRRLPNSEKRQEFERWQQRQGNEGRGMHRRARKQKRNW